MCAVLEAIREGGSDDEMMKQFIEWMRVCFKQDTKKILEMSNNFRNIGREKQKVYLKFSLLQIRNAWTEGYSHKLKQMHDSEQKEFYGNFGKYLNDNNIHLLYKEFEDAVYAVERNANQKILFTDVSLKISNYLRIK